MVASPSRTLRIHASQPPRHNYLGTSSPRSGDLNVTERWVERGGRPWFPITGEIHYTRIPRGRWDEALAQAKAGGLNSVASYVFWRHHEPHPGVFCWDAGYDLRAFIALAARHGLDVIVRLGPWAHGEARHGGFPDWLVEWAEQAGTALRTDDPDYLCRVRRFYAETIAQLKGLTHHDGGPVVGAQIENELYDQPDHLDTLRRVAEDLGLHVPLWTATGWGGAQVPERLLPVYSAYADGFWAGPEQEWPHFSAPHYTHRETRDDLGTGEDVRQALAGEPIRRGNSTEGQTMESGDAATEPPPARDAQTPFVTCEMGGGMHVAYHRRPKVTAEDIEALALAKIGSGSVWQGYYMYAGGSHPAIPGGDQESQATGYPNDVPQISYDFYAPIGEHGQIRPHHHALRRQHLWLAEEGRRLAQMSTTVGHAGEEDLRWAVRSDGSSGYLFLSTYQPARAALPGRDQVQLTVEFDDGAQVRVPTAPADVPSGLYAVWPLRLPLTPEITLRSATAQMVTRIPQEGAHDVVVLCASEGVPAELVLEGRVEAEGPVRTRVHEEDEGLITVITPAEGPGQNCLIRLPGVEVLLLDEAAADQLYVMELGGRRRLLFSEEPLHVLPAHGEQPEALVRVSEQRHSTVLNSVSPEAVAPTPRTGGPSGRLSAPQDFSTAAMLRPEILDEAFEGAHRLLLRVEFTGDVARAQVGEHLISDHFWHGRPWDIDLTSWREQIAEHGLRLEILPWNPDAGIWVDPDVRDAPAGVHVQRADLIRVERTLLTTP